MIILGCRILNKTEDYLEVFSRFKHKENISAVEKILDQTGLERFERSQLGESFFILE